MSTDKDTSDYKIVKTKLSKWFDSIYELFQTEEEDSGTPDLDDNISYEASQIRLIILGSILAALFSTISTILIVLLLTTSGPIGPVILLYEPEIKQVSRFPHLALIYSIGKMTIYEFNSTDHLHQKANFTLQKVKYNQGYFAFEDQNSIHVINSDMRKVHSVIDGQNQHYSVHKDTDRSEIIQ